MPVPPRASIWWRDGPDYLGENTMRSDELLNQQFRATKYNFGYDQREVDTFIDKAAATLKIYEASTVQSDDQHPDVELAHPPITANLVRSVRFTPTHLSEGYDQRDVDDFLDRLALAFQNAEESKSRD